MLYIAIIASENKLNGTKSIISSYTFSAFHAGYCEKKVISKKEAFLLQFVPFISELAL